VGCVGFGRVLMGMFYCMGGLANCFPLYGLLGGRAYPESFRGIPGLGEIRSRSGVFPADVGILVNGFELCTCPMKNLLIMSFLTVVMAKTVFAQTTNNETREKIVSAARSLIGVTEATGRNDGRRIELILATVGLEGTGSPYCAAFNRWCYDEGGLYNIGPRSAWAPDWVKNATWTACGGGATPVYGDVFGIYFSKKKRVAHTGIVEKWGRGVVFTIEGNTSADAPEGSEMDRNGDGIWRKRRLIRQIHAVRDWISTR
jgi:hypothetical protein